MKGQINAYVHPPTNNCISELDTSASKYKGPFSMDYRERGSHTRGVFSKQDTLRMGTAMVMKQEE